MYYGFNTKQMSFMFDREVEPPLCAADWKEPAALVCEIGDMELSHEVNLKRDTQRGVS